MKKYLAYICCAVAAFLLFAACNNNDKKTVTLVYTDKAESVALTFLAASIMDGEYAYKIQTVKAEDDGKAFAMLAEGNADIFLSARLPLHDDIIHTHSEEIVSVGVIYSEARNGFAVPSYVEIDAVTELNDAKGDFEGKIIGIAEGANIMNQAAQAIEDYGLDFELIANGKDAMLENLRQAIENDQKIIVTGWTPHWMFGEWDLKFLEDPLKAFGEPERIEAYAAKDLPEKYPEVGGFLGKYAFEEGEIASLMKHFKEIPSGTDLTQLSKG